MKFNKIFAAVLSVCLSGAVCPNIENIADFSIVASAEEEQVEYTEVTEGYLTFRVYSDHTEISKCDETAQEVIIPSEINGVPIKYIVLGALRSVFNSCKNLTSLDIQCNIENTGYYAFANCENLTSINLPDSLIEICDGTFMNCKSLTKIKIPENVESIGCFTGTIGSGAFYGCENLSEITIPNNVRNIGYNAFRNCKSLNKITIPSGVTSISSWAFTDCESLSEITILNPDCSIGYDKTTICNKSEYSEDLRKFVNVEFTGTIYGYTGSTAQEYAEKWGYNFEVLSDEPTENLSGDANLDGNVTISDAVAILQYLSNADKFPLDGQAKINADCDGEEGVTGKDAAAIQLYDAGVIDSLPLS